MLMGVAALSSGLSSATSKIALGQLAPIDLFAAEVGTGAAMLIPLAAARARGLRRPRFRYLLLGVLEPSVSFLMIDLGLSQTSATHAALLLASETLFVVVLARLALSKGSRRASGRLRRAGTQGRADRDASVLYLPSMTSIRARPRPSEIPANRDKQINRGAWI
jgi:hypothetical protein